MKDEEWRQKLAKEGKNFVQITRVDRVKSTTAYEEEMRSGAEGSAMVGVPKYEWHNQLTVVGSFVSNAEGPAISKANARLKTVKVEHYIADDGKIYPQFEIRRGLVE